MTTGRINQITVLAAAAGRVRVAPARPPPTKAWRVSGVVSWLRIEQTCLKQIGSNWAALRRAPRWRGAGAARPKPVASLRSFYARTRQSARDTSSR